MFTNSWSDNTSPIPQSTLLVECFHEALWASRENPQDSIGRGLIGDIEYILHNNLRTGLYRIELGSSHLSHFHLLISEQYTNTENQNYFERDARLRFSYSGEIALILGNLFKDMQKKWITSEFILLTHGRKFPPLSITSTNGRETPLHRETNIERQTHPNQAEIIFKFTRNILPQSIYSLSSVVEVVTGMASSILKKTLVIDKSIGIQGGNILAHGNTIRRPCPDLGWYEKAKKPTTIDILESSRMSLQLTEKVPSELQKILKTMKGSESFSWKNAIEHLEKMMNSHLSHAVAAWILDERGSNGSYFELQTCNSGLSNLAIVRGFRPLCVNYREYSFIFEADRSQAHLFNQAEIALIVALGENRYIWENFRINHGFGRNPTLASLGLGLTSSWDRSHMIVTCSLNSRSSLAFQELIYTLLRSLHITGFPLEGQGFGFMRSGANSDGAIQSITQHWHQYWIQAKAQHSSLTNNSTNE